MGGGLSGLGSVKESSDDKLGNRVAFGSKEALDNASLKQL